MTIPVRNPLVAKNRNPIWLVQIKTYEDKDLIISQIEQNTGEKKKKEQNTGVLGSAEIKLSTGTSLAEAQGRGFLSIPVTFL